MQHTQKIRVATDMGGGFEVELTGHKSNANVDFRDFCIRSGSSGGVFDGKGRFWPLHRIDLIEQVE